VSSLLIDRLPLGDRVEGFKGGDSSTSIANPPNIWTQVRTVWTYGFDVLSELIMSTEQLRFDAFLDALDGGDGL
jgi:hypothetical protein